MIQNFSIFLFLFYTCSFSYLLSTVFIRSVFDDFLHSFIDELRHCGIYEILSFTRLVELANCLEFYVATNLVADQDELMEFSEHDVKLFSEKSLGSTHVND